MFAKKINLLFNIIIIYLVYVSLIVYVYLTSHFYLCILFEKVTSRKLRGLEQCSEISHSNNITRKNILVTRFPFSKMVDQKRVVSYEDMLKVIHQPEKVIIDVRNPDEIKSTGKIPSSINIPLNNVQDALATMSEEEFKKQFQRPKPSSSDELIFYCQSGRRSSEALDRALKLGYTKSKTYLGSWNDWSSRQK